MYGMFQQPHPELLQLTGRNPQRLPVPVLPASAVATWKRQAEHAIAFEIHDILECILVPVNKVEINEVFSNVYCSSYISRRTTESGAASFEEPETRSLSGLQSGAASFEEPKLDLCQGYRERGSQL
ncbi:hypothetical protein J6590_064461 [Homalodisca vitripennis]|nr:hypothetical protein J6590_064461 [Homalodisca vitripennis]